MENLTNLASIEGWLMLVAGFAVGILLFFNKILHSPWWVRYPIAAMCIGLTLHGSDHLVNFRYDIGGVSDYIIAVSAIALCFAFRGMRFMEKLMNRPISQIEADRIRKTLRDAGLPTPMDGTLRIEDGKVHYRLRENSSIGNKTIGALLEAGMAAKTDPIEMSVAEALKTNENAAMDRDGGGCDVWIELADMRKPMFRS